jgi:triacylglycerol lipase
LAGALVCAGCGETGTVQQAAGSTDIITGAGGGSASSTSATTSATTTGTGGGGGSEGKGPPYPIVMAHGFFGFEDFAGAGFITYFYGVKERLATEGEFVYTPSVDPFNDSEVRGAQLLAHVEQIVAETGSRKVNIIGHSQGGLDARFVAHARPDLVASVIDELFQIIGAPFWDALGNESSVFLPLQLFSQPGIEAFNAKHPNREGVLYASFAGRTAYHGSDNDCDAAVSLPFIERFEGELDPVDPLLSVTQLICAGGFDDAANDGLVRVRDARWGEFWGCVPADHLDEIGQLFGDGAGFGNDWDHLSFYTALVAHLRSAGY